MNNYPRKPNNIKKSEDASKEKQKTQKEQLLEQMKKKQLSKDFKTEANAPLKNKSKPQPSMNNEVGQLKNQIADLDRKLKKAQKEAAADRKKMKSVRNQLKEFENEAQQMIEKNLCEVEAVRKEAELKYQQAEMMMNQLHALGWDQEMNALEELQKRSEFTMLLLQQAIQTNRYLKNAQKRDQNFNQKIRELDRRNHQLEIENKGFKKVVSRKDQKIRQLETEIKERQEKQQELLRVIKKLRSTDPQELIPRLIQQLDKRTFRSFNQLNPLFEKYQWLFECQALSFDEQQGDVLFGFLEVNQEDQLFFHDINEELVMPVTTRQGYKRKDLLIDGMAVQVYRKAGDPDSVALGYCYPIVERQDKQTRHLKRQQRANKKNIEQSFLTNEEVKAWASALTVTIVGNKQAQDLVDQLRRVVNKVVGIDAYEKGERRTMELIRSSDYTFILIDSVPHTITDFAKDYDPLSKKIQVIRSSDKLDGLLWLNYLYWNREGE